MIRPKTRYARNGETNIAYQVVGDGPLDLLFVPAFVSHLDLCWAAPDIAAFFRRLSSFSRLILFDKRGTGLSDPVTAAATLEERMEDVHAVLDACGSERAALFGLSEGGPMSILFAATYPERTAALITFGSFARLLPAPHYMWERRRGVPYADDIRAETNRVWESNDAFRDALENHWGEGRALAIFMPSAARDESEIATLGMFERAAASPSMVSELYRFNAEVDVTQVLPVIGVPTLALHRKDDPVPAAYGRYLAEHISGARYLELEGDDHMPWLGDSDAVVNSVEQFLTGAQHAAEPDRVLSTVLFTDIAGSTARATTLGDDRWRSLLEQHNDLVRRELSAFRGKEVKTLGDGFLATFDGPGRAIRCACAIRAAAASLGLTVRAGVHTGECEVVESDVGGIAVHIAARIVTLASPGEVVVSSAVADLVLGSGLEFTERGAHELKGVPGRWRLLAVSTAPLDSEPRQSERRTTSTLAPNATLTTRADRAALRFVRTAPRLARRLAQAQSAGKRRRSQTGSKAQSGTT